MAVRSIASAGAEVGPLRLTFKLLLLPWHRRARHRDDELLLEAVDRGGDLAAVRRQVALVRNLFASWDKAEPINPDQVFGLASDPFVSGKTRRQTINTGARQYMDGRSLTVRPNLALQQAVEIPQEVFGDVDVFVTEVLQFGAVLVVACRRRKRSARAVLSG